MSKVDPNKIKLYKSMGYALAKELVKPIKEVCNVTLKPYEIHNILQQANVPSENGMYPKEQVLIMLRNHQFDNLVSKYKPIPKPSFDNNNDEVNVPTVLGSPKKNDDEYEDMPEADMERMSQMLIQQYQTESTDKNKKKILISESQFKRLINENLLFEGDSRIKKVEKIIRNAFNGILDVDDIVRGEDYYVNGNPNTTWMQYLIFNLRHTLGLMTNQDVALLPNAANIAYNELNFDKENQDLNKMSTLRKMLDMIKSNPENIQAFTKTPQTFDSIYEIYGKTLEQMDAEMKERINSKEYEDNQNYQILRIENREEAYKYGKYSGIEGEGVLCYTTSDSMWENFTNDGQNTCYLCLRNDWKETPCKPSENYPKDSYGTSMIFLFVNSNGELKYSNSRWNHGNHQYGNVDTMFTTEEISDIVGVNFYQTFKSLYKSESLTQAYLDELKKGTDPYFIFDDIYLQNNNWAVVVWKGKYNAIEGDDGHLISNEWFDWLAMNTDKNYAFVRKGGKSNVIDFNGNPLLEEWVDVIKPSKYIDDVYIVQLNNKQNIVSDKDFSTTLLTQWVDLISFQNNGLIKLGLDNNFNIANREYEMMFDDWIDYIGDFNCNCALVHINGKYNYVDVNGNFISNQWFDAARNFGSNGYGVVYLIEAPIKMNFIDVNGNLFLDNWASVVKAQHKYTIFELNNQQYIYNDDNYTIYNPETKEPISKIEFKESATSYDNIISETINNMLRYLL